MFKVFLVLVSALLIKNTFADKIGVIDCGNLKKI